MQNICLGILEFLVFFLADFDGILEFLVFFLEFLIFFLGILDFQAKFKPSLAKIAVFNHGSIAQLVRASGS